MKLTVQQIDEGIALLTGVKTYLKLIEDDIALCWDAWHEVLGEATDRAQSKLYELRELRERETEAVAETEA
jgi:hypothetical protein